MLKHIRPALVSLVVLTVLTGLVYPLAMTGLAQALFPRQANGSLIEADGRTIGSELIGQAFDSDRYVHGRPSATTAPDPRDPSKTVPAPYNAANSMGSNLGPTNQALLDRVKADVARVKAQTGGAVPSDLVTTSASGLDPHLSPEAALAQAGRVARARGLPEARVTSLINQLTEGRTAGIWGEPRVNVLRLNLALDHLL